MKTKERSRLDFILSKSVVRTRRKEEKRRGWERSGRRAGAAPRTRGATTEINSKVQNNFELEARTKSLTRSESVFKKRSAPGEILSDIEIQDKFSKEK